MGPPSPGPGAAPPPDPAGRRTAWRRVAALAALLAGLALAALALDADRALGAEHLRATLAGAGAVGVLLYLGAFSAGVLLYLPGMIFAGLGGGLYGPVAGPVAALAGAMLSVSLSFALARRVGGRALAELGSERLRRLLARLDGHPVRTTALLRLMFWISPPVNTALALTRIRCRDYLVGSLVGLVVPVTVAALLGAAVVGG